jgi:N-acetyl sugar amidotransferase
MTIACKRCLYDETTPSISFDAEGICNYCRTHEQLERDNPTGEKGIEKLMAIAENVRRAGRRKKYDCIVGVSGGCDSSYMVYLVKEKLGLRPLAAHFDNTWNSTTATQNIQNVLNKLGVDLYTYVVNNREYDDIYRSFMKAGVADIEAPTDIGLAATLNMAAEKYGVKYVFEGHNFRTEGICPLGWLYMDGKYIQSVQNQFGTMPLKTYPNMLMPSFLRWMIVRRIQKIRPFWNLSFNKEEIKSFLSSELGWKWYGGHHLENRFTAFYHSYFMPKRFGKDLRLLGYSALIRTGQMTREEGVRLMREPPYLEPELLEYVKKRLGFNDEQFDHIMNIPKKTYRDYKTYKHTFEKMRPFFWLMAKLNFVPHSFYMKYTAKQ